MNFNNCYHCDALDKLSGICYEQRNYYADVKSCDKYPETGDQKNV